MTATHLRKHIYRVIDQVTRTGAPVEITCRGAVVMIVPKVTSSRTSRLKKRAILKCRPEELVDISWEASWKPFI